MSKPKTVRDFEDGEDDDNNEEQLSMDESIETELREYADEYIKYMNVHPRANNPEFLQHLFENHARINVYDEPRPLFKWEVDRGIDVDPKIQKPALNIDETFSSKSQGMCITKQRYRCIAFVRPAQKGKSVEPFNVDAYLRTVYDRMVKAKKKGSKLSETPAAYLFFFEDMVPSTRGAIYAATPSVFTRDPNLDVCQTAADRETYEWTILSARSAMRAVKKYRETWRKENREDVVEKKREDIYTLYMQGARTIEIGPNWHVPLCGSYRAFSNAVHRYPPQDKKKTEKSTATNFKGEVTPTDEMDERSRAPMKSAKAGASLSSMGKLPSRKASSSTESSSSSSSVKPEAPASREKTLPPLPSRSQEPVKRQRAAHGELSSLEQLRGLLGVHGEPLFSQSMHEQLHGSLQNDVDGIFNEYKKNIVDTRLSLDHKFSGDGKPCFVRGDEKHYLVKYRKATGVGANGARLTPQLYATFGFLNQENDPLAKEYTKDAVKIFPTARTRWGNEAVTPQDHTTIPITPENSGLVKAITLGVNEALCHYEQHLKRSLLTMVDAIGKESGELIEQVKDLEHVLNVKNKNNTDLAGQIEKLQEQLNQCEDDAQALRIELEEAKKSAADVPRDGEGLDDI